MRNLQEQVKKAFCYQNLFWPFTVWINCSSDLKNFAISRPSASNFKSFSRSLEQFFLTAGQINFGNKICTIAEFVVFNQTEILTILTYNLVIFDLLIIEDWFFWCFLITLYFIIHNSKYVKKYLVRAHRGYLQILVPAKSKKLKGRPRCVSFLLPYYWHQRSHFTKKLNTVLYFTLLHI